MLDTSLRRLYAPRLAVLARVLHRNGVGPTQVTAVGFILGLAAAGAAGLAWWPVALVLWLASRVADGLDGMVARLDAPSASGGFFDIVADFSVYAAFVVGVAIAEPTARLAAAVLLSTYYVSGAAFLAWSSLQASDDTHRPRSSMQLEDERSIRFVGGLAEGFETVVAYCIVCLIPSRSATVFWVFAAMVAVTAAQRVLFAATHLRSGPDQERATAGKAEGMKTPVASPLAWSSPSDIPRVVFDRRNLTRTVSVALVVGTVLFAINQLDVVVSGTATTGTWIKAASTYVVPFCVANYGVLSATRRRTV